MFKENIYTHSVWRKDVDERLKKLSRWLSENDLMLSDVELLIGKMQQNSRSDKIMVAFVAEFSRGKSELINAIFFASYGKRIMPASAGRTTMCPTELGYDDRDSACLRLLPIQTRLESQPLMEWRLVPEQWTKVELDVSDPEQLIEAMARVSETIEVEVEEARALGFWHDGATDNPMVTAEGKVEVPKWRHALINMDHPLLRQGLIILDTPGLNAIGAEPELTMSLIPQAQAVVFILATDTGVTASDLSMWREFLSGAEEDDASRFVVLNKIDTLWDELATPEQNEVQIEKQRVESARILGISKERVMTVSAQKGLLAKVTSDNALLKRSHLDQLENMLGQGIVERRHEIMQIRLQDDLEAIQQQIQRLLDMRTAELTEQVAELDGLNGKNDAVVRHQRMRVAKEQETFEISVGKAHALRGVHQKVLKQIYALLGSNQLLKETALLNRALRDSGFMKVGVKKAYADTFIQLNGLLKQVEKKSNDLHDMFSNMFKQFNTEYGFTLKVERPPKLQPYAQELVTVQESHSQYLGVGNLLKLSQPEFIDRLLRALVSRLRIVFERALNDIEHWSRKTSSQLDTQLKERRRGLKRRVQSIERAQVASSNLGERTLEIQEMVHAMQNQKTIFLAHIDQLNQTVSTRSKTQKAPEAKPNVKLVEQATSADDDAADEILLDGL